jgi:hypothetical protein
LLVVATFAERQNGQLTADGAAIGCAESGARILVDLGLERR